MQNGSGDRDQTLQMVRGVMAQLDETYQRQENMLQLSYADLCSRLEQLRLKVQFTHSNSLDDRGGMGSALAGLHHSPSNAHLGSANAVHTASPFSVTAPADTAGGVHSSTPIRAAFCPSAGSAVGGGNVFFSDRLGFNNGPSMFSTGQGTKNASTANTSTPMRDPSQMMGFKAPGSAVPDANDWSALSMLQQEPIGPGAVSFSNPPDPSILGSPQSTGKLSLDDLLARFAGGPSPASQTGAYTSLFNHNNDGDTSPVVNFDSIYEEIAGNRDDSYPGVRGGSASSNENAFGGFQVTGTHDTGGGIAPHTPSKTYDRNSSAAAGSAAGPGPAGEKNTIPIDMLRSLHDQHLTTSVRAVYEGGRPKVVPVRDGAPEDPSKLGIDRSLACRVLVEFKRKRVLQYDSDSYVAPGSYVVVGGDRGEDLGLVIYTWCEINNANAPRSNSTDGKPSVVGVGLSGSLLTRSMGVGSGTVLRAATDTEVEQLYGSQAELERRAVDVCAQRVLDHGLPMVIVDAEYQFDKKKLTFFYEAQQRMDFRELVRDLYKTFRARIWMEVVDQ